MELGRKVRGWFITAAVYTGIGIVVGMAIHARLTRPSNETSVRV